MSINAASRRAALSTFGAFAVLSFGGAWLARAQPVVRFHDIRVDVWPLRGSAGDQIADWVEDELPRDLARALSPYIAQGEGNGATLLARVENIDFGAAGGGRGSGGSVDSMDGVLIVSGARTGLAAQTPLRAVASYQSSALDQPMFEEAYHSRVAALAEAFAGWAPRQLGI
jgi:hypothetical protein